MLLSSAPRFDRPGCRRLSLRLGAGIHEAETGKNFIGCILQPGVGLVQLPGRLARQLAELVTIGHVRECPVNQIRTHKINLLPDLSTLRYLAQTVQLLGSFKVELRPKQPVLPLDARIWHRVRKTFALIKHSAETGGLPFMG
jgi:hypothetical protein